MSNSPYKREPDGNVFDLLGQRKKTYKQGPHYQAATRNPAYCKIHGNGMTIPGNDETFDSMYSSRFKPAPILTNASVSQGGDFGLVMELKATIQCHTLDDFIQVEKAFLIPGTNVHIEFGYPIPRPDEGYQKSKVLKGFKVATYGFNTTDEGFWIAEFKAVSPGTSINAIDMGISFEPHGRIYKGKDNNGKVSGIGHLIAYDAQVNGSISVDEMGDGEVVIPTKHIPANPGAVVIYHTEHLWSNEIFRKVYNWISKGNEVSKTDNIVYVTLEYIVNRLINNELLDKYQKRIPDKDFVKCLIKFDPTLSYSYTDNQMCSAYPTQVLFLGLGKGNYMNVSGKGKDFEKCTNLNAIKSNVGTVESRLKVDHKKILINRDVILQAFDDAYTEKKTAETNNPKQAHEGTINISTFFEKIFNEISKASGGMIKLRLSQHPDIHKGKDENKAYSLFIFDENNGYDPNPVKCWVFDPIDGDGTTRSCSITSDVGGKEYQGAMFASQMKSADPVHEVNSMDGGNTSGRAEDRQKAVMRMIEIVKNPGSIGNNQFSTDEMQALEQAMGTLRTGMDNGKKFDMLVYVGLGIDITIDGVYGILPGNAVFSTQLPSKYRDANTYFFVETVEHTFDGSTSDWSTKIQGKLAFHNNVDYLGI